MFYVVNTFGDAHNTKHHFSPDNTLCNFLQMSEMCGFMIDINQRSWRFSTVRLKFKKVLLPRRQKWVFTILSFSKIFTIFCSHHVRTLEKRFIQISRFREEQIFIRIFRSFGHCWRRYSEFEFHAIWTMPTPLKLMSMWCNYICMIFVSYQIFNSYVGW